MTQATAESLNTILPTPIAEQGDKNDSLPQGVNNTTDESVSSAFGFPEIFSRSISKDGGKPIQRDEMNTLFNILSRQITYFQLGGVATWKASVVSSSYFDGYPPEAIVWHNGCQWRNVGGTTNKTEPGTDSSIGWTQIGPTAGTGTTSLDCQKLCPTLDDLHQLIDWANISGKTTPKSGKAITGFLPSTHANKSDDVGYLVGPGVEIQLKDSWWNWQNVFFIVDTSTANDSPDIQFATVPSVYMYMGMEFRQANISKGVKKLANYRWGLDMSHSNGDFNKNMLWIDLSKDFTTKKFTLGGGGYVHGIYGMGDCSSCRVSE